MDKFKNRIKYYLVGFLMGIIAITFFFGQRGCAWLPGNRVKTTITEQKIVVGDSIQALLNCLADDSQPIFDLLNTDGDVNFGESETEGHPQRYRIENGNGLVVDFKIYDNYSEIVSVKSPEITCDVSALTNQVKHRLILPKKIINQIIDQHAFTFYDIAKCQMACYGIPEEDVVLLHKSGKNYRTSEREDLVNRIFIVTTNYNGTDYDITYEIGENRTRIKSISGHADCHCE